MLNLKQVRELREHKKIAFDNLTGAMFLDLLDTLEAALIVVEAAKADNAKRGWLLNLDKTLAPFRTAKTGEEK